MKFLIGKKQNMTQVFDENGKVYPATILVVGESVVTQVKTDAKDGYSAIQVGYGARNKKNIAKAQQGHAGKLGDFAGFKEMRASKDVPNDLKVGTKLDLSIFESGELVTVSAITKGKGFQGVVKRHGFHGGPRTHGQKHTERAPGSIGATGPQRVFKGKRMGGRMGADRVTVQKVKILQIDKDGGQLLVKGSIPGRRGTLVEIRGM